MRWRDACAAKAAMEVDLSNAHLPAEIIAQVAEYCSARDQVVIKLLCKGVNGFLPKAPLLNLNYFKQSCYLYLKKNGDDFAVPVQCQFKLNPNVVEMQPFAVLEFISDYFKDERLSWKWVILLPKLMGNCLEAALLRVVLQYPKHPKLILLNLLIASLANCVPAINFLLMPANRSKIQKKDYGIAVRYACGVGCPEALKVLLEDPSVDPSNMDNWPIRLAAGEGNTSCVQLLLQHPRVNPADDHNAALRLTIQGNHVEAFNTLYQDDRVDPSDYDNYCIIHSARQGHLAIFQTLLGDPRVNPASMDNAPIRRASENGHTAVVRLLLEDSRVDASAFDNEALKLAREKGHLEVETLLEEHLANRSKFTITRSGRKSIRRLPPPS